MRMKKIVKNKKELKNPYGIKDINLYDDADMVDGNERGVSDCNSKLPGNISPGTKGAENGIRKSNDKSFASERDKESDENKSVNDNEKTEDGDKKDEEECRNNFNPEQSSIETEMDPEKKMRMMKEREESMRINMTDCHTLLAQLNTKRLYRRIKYFKRKDSNYDVDKAYAYNKDTVEIS